ncbi:hypothetical protein Rhow_003266 [Rhodococcus wratislaviensis]|uniref:Uncharacterized protein n=1 Tax=Rhodococcus wratislaviensis TaxID=44752 RepID=A0A402BZ92_RHOWR|nr:hypothetical protein Rhow_003266 [Rhodococcus wratislaviensis]
MPGHALPLTCGSAGADGEHDEKGRTMLPAWLLSARRD